MYERRPVCCMVHFILCALTAPPCCVLALSQLLMRSSPAVATSVPSSPGLSPGKSASGLRVAVACSRCSRSTQRCSSGSVSQAACCKHHAQHILTAGSVSSEAGTADIDVACFSRCAHACIPAAPFQCTSACTKQCLQCAVGGGSI